MHHSFTKNAQCKKPACTFKHNGKQKPQEKTKHGRAPDLLLNANIRITSVIKKAYDKIYFRDKQVIEESWIKRSISDLLIVQSFQEIQAEQFNHDPLDKVKSIKIEVTEFGKHLSAAIVKDYMLKVIPLLRDSSHRDTTQTELCHINRHILELCPTLVATCKEIVVHHVTEVCIVITPFAVRLGRYESALMVDIHEKRHQRKLHRRNIAPRETRLFIADDYIATVDVNPLLIIPRNRIQCARGGIGRRASFRFW